MPDTKNETLEFMAMLAHDMKSPVKAQIRGMNLLYSGAFGDFTEEARNLILNIIASNKYLECLLDDILNDYLLNFKSFHINKIPNDFRKTLEDALCNIGILSEVKNQKIEIKYHTGNFIKEYDEAEIQRVVINLLANAFEYAVENSKIKISVSKEGENLKMLIESKTGFEPLNTVKNTRQYGRNCGLGLIICKKIIEAHAGSFINELAAGGEYLSGFILS